MFLIGSLPVVDLGTTLLKQRVERLQAVGGLEALAEKRKDVEAVQGKRLLKAFCEARRRRFIAQRQFLVQPFELALRLIIGRALIRLLQPPTPKTTKPTRTQLPGIKKFSS